jgi:hypothetical protein
MTAPDDFDRQSRKTRLRAGGAALLLLLTGAVLGIKVERLFNAPAPLEARGLTADAVAERLDLSPDEAVRLTALLDSIHGELMTAELESPEARRLATQEAHRRIEASLPPHAAPAFRAWIQEHREHMMHHMGSHPGGPGMGSGMGPGMGSGMGPGMRHMGVPPDS